MFFPINNIFQHKLINLRMLMKIMGWLLLIEAAFLIVPVIVSLSYGESDWKYFLGTSLLTATCGLLLAKRSHPKTQYMGKRDGFLLTASVWVVFSLFGLLPFIFGSLQLSFTNAFFEAMSGFTTTGASVLPAGKVINHGMHIWRALIQWLGGMGIILFTLAVIPMLNHSGGMQMFNAEATGITHDKISPRISSTAKSLWLIYFGLTVTLIFLLWLGPMDIFDSVCYAFGTVSTGGYATSEYGVGPWAGSAYVKLILTLFMFLGGVNFGLIYKFLHGEFKGFAKNDVFKTYVSLIGIITMFFILTVVYHNKVDGWTSLSIDPLFQVVSTLSTTGYALSSVDTWGSFVFSLMLVMMFFGGCAGSTSGGAKIDRILYLFKNSSNELYRCLYPRSVRSVKVNDRVINPELVTKVIAFLCIYMLLIVAGGIVITACNVPVVDAFYSAFSSISNNFIGSGITTYGSSYDILPNAAKWVLSLLMMTGRLEVFTVLVLFSPAFWRR